MEIIAAPGRQFKTISFWLLVSLFVFDSLGSLLGVFESVKFLSHEGVIVINAVVVFITGIVRFIQQNIPVTPDEKAELIEAAHAAPVKPIGDL